MLAFKGREEKLTPEDKVAWLVPLDGDGVLRLGAVLDEFDEDLLALLWRHADDLGCVVGDVQGLNNGCQSGDSGNG